MHRRRTLNGRQYPCRDLSCDSKLFATRSDLKRHQREVHRKDEDGKASPVFPCLIESCERHMRGFSRRSNLQDHCSRVHRLDLSLQELTEDSDTIVVKVSNDHGCPPDGDDSRSAFPKADNQRDTMIARPEASDSACKALRTRISTLERERIGKITMCARIDREIKHLKESIALLEGRKDNIERASVDLTI